MDKYTQSALMGLIGFISLVYKPMGILFLIPCVLLMLHGLALRFNRYPLPKRFEGHIMRLKRFRRIYSTYEILFSITLLSWYSLTHIINNAITLFVIYTILVFILLTYKNELISQYTKDDGKHSI